MSNYMSGGGTIPTVRDSESGYQWAVTASQVALEKDFSISRHWLLSIKGNLSHLNDNMTVGGGIKYDF